MKVGDSCAFIYQTIASGLIASSRGTWAYPGIPLAMVQSMWRSSTPRSSEPLEKLHKVVKLVVQR